jgi:hypothetical protein
MRQLRQLFNVVVFVTAISIVVCGSVPVLALADDKADDGNRTNVDDHDQDYDYDKDYDYDAFFEVQCCRLNWCCFCSFSLLLFFILTKFPFLGFGNNLWPISSSTNNNYLFF